METKIIKTENGVVIFMTGRLDTITSGKFQETLTDTIKENDRVELNFSNVQYVSSAGLRTLLIGQKLANAGGKTMILSHIPKMVMDVLKMTGFVNFLKIR